MFFADYRARPVALGCRRWSRNAGRGAGHIRSEWTIGGDAADLRAIILTSSLASARTLYDHVQQIAYRPVRAEGARRATVEPVVAANLLAPVHRIDKLIPVAGIVERAGDRAGHSWRRRAVHMLDVRVAYLVGDAARLARARREVASKLHSESVCRKPGVSVR